MKVKRKYLYFSKKDFEKKREAIAKMKEENTILKIKHVKSSGSEEKIIVVMYIPKEKDICFNACQESIQISSTRHLQ